MKVEKIKEIEEFLEREERIIIALTSNSFSSKRVMEYAIKTTLFGPAEISSYVRIFEDSDVEGDPATWMDRFEEEGFNEVVVIITHNPIIMNHTNLVYSIDFITTDIEDAELNFCGNWYGFDDPAVMLIDICKAKRTLPKNVGELFDDYYRAHSEKDLDKCKKAYETLKDINPNIIELVRMRQLLDIWKRKLNNGENVN